MKNNQRYSKDIEDVLINHGKLYPTMEIQDLIKLIYQFSLGPNHLLIKDLNKVKESIFLEAKNNKFPNKEIIYIGNDLYRVTLVNDEDYLEEVFEAFIKTTKEYTGKIEKDTFKNNIEISLNYLSLFKNIDKKDYIGFVKEYINEGMPLISHSLKFKESYHPSYRLVHKKYLNLLNFNR